MASVRFGDISHLYWQVSKAMDAGHTPSIEEVRDALDARDITTFLDQHPEVDLSLYGSPPTCSLDELDAALEQWSAATATDLSLSSDANGLVYLAGVIVNLLQNGSWEDNSGREIDITNLEMGVSI